MYQHGRDIVDHMPEPMTKPTSNPDLAFLAGGGEMGERIRDFDWSATPIGPSDSWSPGLRMMVSFLLANRFPMLLWWGPSFISIYNDPYAPILGTKHPWALGLPVSECWSEIWHILRPLVETPYLGGPATWMEDLQVEINRHGFLEETHFTIAYSPVPEEGAPRGIGGVVATVHEISGKVVAERRVAALRDLGARLSEARTPEQACAIAAETLATYDKDIPFALLYLADEKGGSPSLVSGTTAAEAADWPWDEAAAAPVVVDRLEERFSTVPPGPWSDPPNKAVILPIVSGAAPGAAGYLVAGVSARLALDDQYRDFLGLVRAQIGSAVANARAYEEERQRAEALAELDRAKTVFFSNVSHEFRTPLTLQLGPLEDVLSDSGQPVSPAQRDKLEIAHRNSLRLLKLVNSLLEFSRIEAGRIQATYLPTDLAALSSDLASTFRSAVERAGLVLRVECQPLVEPVHVDRDMWEKIVLNLLSNALKHTFDGEILVRLRATEAGAELVVRDTGVGIAAHQLPRLFERFHRVPQSRARTQEGSGIGLALVQELVRLHGGKVEVDSREGVGTAFTVTVPFGTAHLARDAVMTGTSDGRGDGRSAATAAASYVEEALRWLPDSGSQAPHAALDHVEGAIPADGLPAPRARILVADDNSDMRSYVSRLLRERWQVDTVSDGLSALEAVGKHPPDLIVADIMMPGLDGFELLRRLRAEPETREVPVILLSARAGEESRVEGLDAGADDYLVKPFSARELIARVGATLHLVRVRRESAEALRESEARFRALVTASSDVVYRMSADWGEMRQLVGREFIPDTLTPSHSWVDRYILAEDQPAVLSAIRKAIRTRKPFQLEHRVLRVDGSVGWTISRAIPILNDAGEVLEWFGAASDVTRRKEAEEVLRRRHAQFETLLNDLPVGVYLVDAAFRIRHVNPAALPAFGDIPDVIGQDFGDLVRRIWPAAHADELVRLFSRTLATGGSYHMPEDVQRRLDRGTIESYEWEIHRIELPEGGHGVVCYFRDISGELAARETLIESEERLRQAAKMEAIGRLAGGVAHDFNNQLQGISGFARMVAKDPGLGAASRRDLGELQRAAERMAGLTRQLLAFSRQQFLQPETLDLNVAVTDGQSLLQRLIGSNIEIGLHLARERLWTRADPAQLLQVLMNLAINARDAMPEGGELTIRTARQTVTRAGEDGLEPGAYVELTVSDTGSGIAAGDLGRVFEPFFTTKEVGQGTGLGLATVHGIVTQSRGHIRVDSAPGRGARFTVLLPAAEPPSSAPPSVEEPKGQSPAGRLLVVDDEEMVRSIMARLLREERYTVFEARNGRDALDTLAQERGAVDLMVSDVVMPVLGGRELRKRLARDYPEVPIVWMSGYPRESVFEGPALPEGASFLQKPVDPEVLIVVVRDILSRVRS